MKKQMQRFLAQEYPKKKKKKKIRKPRKLKERQGKCYWSVAKVEIEFGQPRFYFWPDKNLRRPNDIRKLAAWLTRAAEWIEQQEASK